LQSVRGHQPAFAMPVQTPELVPDECKLYRAALEWDLTDPIEHLGPCVELMETVRSCCLLGR